jgi:hypothetical protein
LAFASASEEATGTDQSFPEKRGHHQRSLGLWLLEIQFNGIGGLLTYISLMPNADVSALGSYGEAQCRNLVL